MATSMGRAVGVVRGFVFLWAVTAALAASSTACEDEPPASDEAYTTRWVEGQVVWLDEALRGKGVEMDPDAAHSATVLVTASGDLYPLVKDARGRGFWLDNRLRKVDVALLVRQHRGSPLIQVIRVCRVLAEGRRELDYWCDVCAIPMFELKACECCQGETRIRLRKLDEHGEPQAE